MVNIAKRYLSPCYSDLKNFIGAKDLTCEAVALCNNYSLKLSNINDCSSISTNSNTSTGHPCILSRKYFPIASLDREQLENHNYIYLWHLH